MSIFLAFRIIKINNNTQHLFINKDEREENKQKGYD